MKCLALSTNLNGSIIKMCKGLVVNTTPQCIHRGVVFELKYFCNKNFYGSRELLTGSGEAALMKKRVEPKSVETVPLNIPIQKSKFFFFTMNKINSFLPC